MPPVFAHGRLRLYLLKLLDEAPRHGYEIIRLLEERFQGLYAPSAGTVYPRLAKLEAEGLVTHATEGGRKVYSITDAGREELAGRGGELADLELEIRDSLSELAAEIRDDVRGAAGRLRSDMRAAASESRHGAKTGAGQGVGYGAGSGSGADAGSGSGSDAGSGSGSGTENEKGGQKGDSSSPFGDFGGFGDFGALGDLGDSEAWRTAKEELRRARQEWKEQARRAKDESRRAREDAQQARRQAKEAQDKAREQMQAAARQVQEHFARGDWPAGVREGLAEITGQLGGFARSGAWPPFGKPGPESAPPVPDPAPGADWGQDVPTTGDPARDLDRLLDRFRDGVRDAARDHGVTEDQLGEARRHLGAAAARIEALLSPEDGDGNGKKG
ncbi:PadR family transcriptional regulator [Streptomyces sp. sk226]|uniref:PadR family transcriptional regulator n=1 Tax=Streptomyces sp. sk226 TaxID=2034268 RepID=UPI000BF06243|nr:PadR family transcriptional regulator [Streptomyces sp. sk226]